MHNQVHTVNEYVVCVYILLYVYMHSNTCTMIAYIFCFSIGELGSGMYPNTVEVKTTHSHSDCSDGKAVFTPNGTIQISSNGSLEKVKTTVLFSNGCRVLVPRSEEFSCRKLHGSGDYSKVDENFHKKDGMKKNQENVGVTKSSEEVVLEGEKKVHALKEKDPRLYNDTGIYMYEDSREYLLYILTCAFLYITEKLFSHRSHTNISC